MPCYEVNRISVDLNIADKSMLEEVIKEMGFTYVINKDGSMTVQTQFGSISIKDGFAKFSDQQNQNLLNKIKQKYSRLAIEKVAKKYGFSIAKQPGEKIVLRRY